ncbi:MAG TPA: hypothetical protein PLS50_08250 [Candidatus Dojkabacteria bacterium]|nr:hypothetical protein [Candidatus Dojkabacteria bacterium]
MKATTEFKSFLLYSIFVVLPLFVGGSVYYYPQMFEKLRGIQLKLANYYLADFLWAFSFTSFIIILNPQYLNRWLLCVVILINTTEFLQFFYPALGRFDYLDIFFMSLSYVLAILLTRKIKLV